MPTLVPTKTSLMGILLGKPLSPAAGPAVAFSPVVVSKSIDAKASAIRTIAAAVRVIVAGVPATVARVQVKVVTGPAMMLHQLNVQAIVEPAMGICSVPIKMTGETLVFLPNVLSLVIPSIAAVKPVDTIAEVFISLVKGGTELMRAKSSVI